MACPPSQIPDFINGKMPPAKPAKLPLFARMPPAVFPAIFGGLGLVLGWRKGVGMFVLPIGFIDLFAGAMAILAAFALIGYAVKIGRRPSVVLEELMILPGRTGLAAMVLSIYLLALLFAPYLGGMLGLLYLGLGLHAVLIVLLIRQFTIGAKEQARVTPAWQLSFTGPIVGAFAALTFERDGLAVALFWPSLASALIIWGISLDQFRRASVPPPLRPLLMIHLSPAALLGLVATGLGYHTLAMIFAVLSVVLIAVFTAAGRWLTVDGFSPFWSAFTFPLAGTATFWITLGGAWAMPGALLLIVATLTTFPIMFRILKMWSKGQLAIKSNASTA
jgi:tellurite resistance protein